MATSVNPSNYESIAPFPPQSDPDKDFLVHIVVETPQATRHKYAFDRSTGLFALRTTIPDGLQWPYDYGFVPGTLGEDGDALDVLYLNDAATFPGCLTEGRLLGVIRLEKNGYQNDRFLACAKRINGVSLSTDPYERIADVPRPTIESITRFLVDYSEGTGNRVKVTGIDGRRKALEAIRSGIERYTHA